MIPLQCITVYLINLLKMQHRRISTGMFLILPDHVWDELMRKYYLNILKWNLWETWAFRAVPLCAQGISETWQSFTGWTCKPAAFCLWKVKNPILKQPDQSGWIANEMILTLSYLISLPRMLKAVCTMWYFVLPLKPQLLLYHCSEKPFREFWIAVMIWFSPRVTPKHKGPLSYQVTEVL